MTTDRPALKFPPHATPADIALAIRERLWENVTQPTPPAGKPFYLQDWKNNLVPGVDSRWVHDQLAKGSGNELAGKFRAVHSSSALAANTFGHFSHRPQLLELASTTGFNQVEIERKCPTGLRGTPPNLDVFLTSDTSIIAIESKFLEYLSPKRPHFSEAYNRDRFPKAEDPWWDYVAKANAGHICAQELDVAQLVKHYLGLINLDDANGRSIMLLYLFWEPRNWRGVQPFERHRRQVAAFADRVTGTSIAFQYMSYPELWSKWESASALASHVAALRARYAL